MRSRGRLTLAVPLPAQEWNGCIETPPSTLVLTWVMNVLAPGDAPVSHRGLNHYRVCGAVVAPTSPPLGRVVKKRARARADADRHPRLSRGNTSAALSPKPERRRTGRRSTRAPWPLTPSAVRPSTPMPSNGVASRPSSANSPRNGQSCAQPPTPEPSTPLPARQTWAPLLSSP